MFEENMRQLEGETVVLVEDGLVITWNGGATFNVYNYELENFDCFTVYDIETISAATEVANDHLREMMQ